MNKRPQRRTVCFRSGTQANGCQVVPRQRLRLGSGPRTRDKLELDHQMGSSPLLVKVGSFMTCSPLMTLRYPL